MRANASTFGDERLTQLDGERAPEGVGARLVRQPPDRDLLSGDAAEELSQPADGPGAVRVVAPLDSPQQVRGKARLERRDRFTNRKAVRGGRIPADNSLPSDARRPTEASARPHVGDVARV